MDGVMKKMGLILAMMIIGNLSHAQYGLTGGLSMLKGFGIPKPFVGFHLGAEFPQNDQNSIYGRLSFYAKQRDTLSSVSWVSAIDLTANPPGLNVAYQSSMNYTILEGGNRYYIGDGYDSGFGAYGGATFMLIFNTVKRNYEDFDETKYTLPINEVPKGSILGLGIGFNGGLKHTLAGIGTFYLDANLAYRTPFLTFASNSTALNTTLYSGILFTFNVGFRKEFY